MSELDQVMAEITPQRVHQVVYAVAERADGSLRSLVAVESIVSELIGAADLGDGQRRGRAIEQVRLLIRKVIGEVPGLKYVAGSP